uniref:CBS domain-containing protein n=1 Tax=Arundo donax TaxID=35708 RepID=A0A0A9DBM4_ARUDO
MREFRVNSVVVATGNTLQGIFTSKDVLMRVVAQNISPELTLVEKVMTANPDCATLDTTILDALHIMHDGKFLHIPVIDRDGQIAACLDVLQLTHATIQLVEGGNGTVNDVANSVMQRFWDSALALEPPDEEFDSHRFVAGSLVDYDFFPITQLFLYCSAKYPYSWRQRQEMERVVFILLSSVIHLPLSFKTERAVCIDSLVALRA